MAPTRVARSTARGTTLLEAVIALSILLVGIVGMLRLQFFGANSDEAGRSYTQAVQIGHELLAGLERLAVEDTRLAATFGGDPAPADFGHLLLPSGDLTSTPFTAWSDSLAVAGVTRDADLLARNLRDPVDGSLPRFQRRWTVWMPTTPIAVNSSKVIAVSVIWRERGAPGLREVVLYGSAINPTAVTSIAGRER